VVEVDPVVTWLWIIATWGLLPILQIAYGVYRWWCDSYAAEDFRVWLRKRLLRFTAGAVASPTSAPAVSHLHTDAEVSRGGQ
jgi:O-antigen ligase